MAVNYQAPTFSGGTPSSLALTQAFADIEAALRRTVGIDGDSPNAMEEDLDLNGHDLLNVGALGNKLVTSDEFTALSDRVTSNEGDIQTLESLRALDQIRLNQTIARLDSLESVEVIQDVLTSLASIETDIDILKATDSSLTPRVSALENIPDEFDGGTEQERLAAPQGVSSWYQTDGEEGRYFRDPGYGWSGPFQTATNIRYVQTGTYAQYLATDTTIPHMFHVEGESIEERNGTYIAGPGFREKLGGYTGEKLNSADLQRNVAGEIEFSDDRFLARTGSTRYLSTNITTDNGPALKAYLEAGHPVCVIPFNIAISPIVVEPKGPLRIILEGYEDALCPIGSYRSAGLIESLVDIRSAYNVSWEGSGILNCKNEISNGLTIQTPDVIAADFKYVDFSVDLTIENMRRYAASKGLCSGIVMLGACYPSLNASTIRNVTREAGAGNPGAQGCQAAIISKKDGVYPRFRGNVFDGLTVSNVDTDDLGDLRHDCDAVVIFANDTPQVGELYESDKTISARSGAFTDVAGRLVKIQGMEVDLQGITLTQKTVRPIDSGLNLIGLQGSPRGIIRDIKINIDGSVDPDILANVNPVPNPNFRNVVVVASDANYRDRPSADLTVDGVEIIGRDVNPATSFVAPVVVGCGELVESEGKTILNNINVRGVSVNHGFLSSTVANKLQRYTLQNSSFTKVIDHLFQTNLGWEFMHTQITNVVNTGDVVSMFKPSDLNPLAYVQNTKGFISVPASIEKSSVIGLLESLVVREFIATASGSASDQERLGIAKYGFTGDVTYAGGEVVVAPFKYYYESDFIPVVAGDRFGAILAGVSSGGHRIKVVGYDESKVLVPATASDVNFGAGVGGSRDVGFDVLNVGTNTHHGEEFIINNQAAKFIKIHLLSAGVTGFNAVGVHIYKTGTRVFNDDTLAGEAIEQLSLQSHEYVVDALAENAPTYTDEAAAIADAALASGKLYVTAANVVMRKP